jgi:hypothetical protein
MKLVSHLLLAKLHKAYHPENNVLPKAKIFSWENQHYFAWIYAVSFMFTVFTLNTGNNLGKCSLN